MELKVNVYDSKGKVKKTAKAETVDLPFGAVTTIFEVIKLEDVNSDMEVIKIIAEAWSELKPLVNDIFPTLTKSEISNLKAKEVLPVILCVIKESFKEILTIPTDPN